MSVRVRQTFSIHGRTPWLLLLPVPLSAALLGSVPVWALTLTGCVAALTLVFVSLDKHNRGPLPAPALVLLALAGFTLLQAVPMPIGLLEVLSPNAASTWRGALRPLGESVTRGSISMDAGATMVEALKLITYACVFIVSSTMARHRGRTVGVASVFACALFLLVTGVAHAGLGATRVWGIYEPTKEASRALLAPLINPNCLAGYLNFGAFCGLGFALGTKESKYRWFALAGCAALFAGVIATQSRGGVGAAVVGVGAFCFLALARRQQRASSAASRMALKADLIRLTLGFGVLAVLVALLAFSARQSGALPNLLDTNFEKLALNAHVAPLVRDHLWLGIGRGAFESVFTAYTPSELDYNASIAKALFTHPENLVAQWVSEWGIVIGSAALLYFAWAFRPSQLGARARIQAVGVWAGLFALVLHNMVDLSSEVPAIPVALFAAVGSCWGAERARRDARSSSPASGPEWRKLHPAMGAAGLLLALALGTAGRPTVFEDRVRASELLTKRSPADRTIPKDALRTAMLRHPAEPYFSLVGAELARKTGAESAFPWLQRALERGPHVGANHFVLAQSLARVGALKQALLELRLAAGNDGRLAPQVATSALAWTRDPALLSRALPQGSRGSYVLASMVQRNPLSTDASLRREFLEKAREVLAEEPEPRRMLAQEWLAECERAPRAECSMAAERHIDWLQRNTPDAPDTALLQARRTAAQGDFAEADRLLQAACHSQQDPVPCLRLRARFAAKVGPEALEKAAKALVAHESGNDELCAASHEYVGQLFNELGAPGSALTHFNAAADRLPTAARWAQVAVSAHRAGETTLAATAYERAARLDPTGSYAAKAAQLRGTLPAGSASRP